MSVVHYLRKINSFIAAATFLGFLKYNHSKIFQKIVMKCTIYCYENANKKFMKEATPELTYFDKYLVKSRSSIYHNTHKQASRDLKNNSSGKVHFHQRCKSL